MDSFGDAIYTGLTDEEKERIRKQQLMAMGAAMLAGRGNFAQNLGQGMLVGINQGESATTQLRRDKLAEMEMAYRQSLMAKQQQAAQLAMEKQRTDMEAAQRAAEMRGEVQGILGATDPRAIMGSLAPTPRNAQRMDELATDSEEFKRAQYERSIQKLALGGDEKIANVMQALFKELNPNAEREDPQRTLDFGTERFD